MASVSDITPTSFSMTHRAVAFFKVAVLSLLVAGLLCIPLVTDSVPKLIQRNWNIFYKGELPPVDQKTQVCFAEFFPFSFYKECRPDYPSLSKEQKKFLEEVAVGVYDSKKEAELSNSETFKTALHLAQAQYLKADAFQTRMQNAILQEVF